MEHYLSYRESDGVSALFGRAIERARLDADQADRAEVAARIGNAVAGLGLTNAEFARLVGTSASRFSTYLSGKVAPSSVMLLRIERTARDLQRSSEGETSAVCRGRD